MRRALRQADPPRYARRLARTAKLDAFKRYIEDRVRAAHPDWIPAAVLYREIRAQGYAGGETRVRDFVRALKPKAPPEPLVRFETQPGEQMQVDWASFRRGELYAFVATLGYSRATYRQPARTRNDGGGPGATAARGALAAAAAARCLVRHPRRRRCRAGPVEERGAGRVAAASPVLLRRPAAGGGLNNVVERAIHPIAVGRGNWLFVGSERGGEAAAVILSLVETCKLHGGEPYHYLADVLRRLPSYSINRVVELLPFRWKAAHARSPLANAA